MILLGRAPRSRRSETLSARTAYCQRRLHPIGPFSALAARRYPGLDGLGDRLALAHRQLRDPGLPGRRSGTGRRAATRAFLA